MLFPKPTNLRTLKSWSLCRRGFTYSPRFSLSNPGINTLNHSVSVYHRKMSASASGTGGRDLPKSVEMIDDILLTLDTMDVKPFTGVPPSQSKTSDAGGLEQKLDESSKSPSSTIKSKKKKKPSQSKPKPEASSADKPKQLSKKEKKALKAAKKKAKMEAMKAAKEAGPKKEKKKRSREVKELPSYFLHDSQTAHKKSLSEPMKASYDTESVESDWDSLWQQMGHYKPMTEEDATKAGRNGQFVMMLPPPNVTGSLHLGHALMATVEDTITRYWRMKGKNCLWLPGTDHAGIATQSVVERMLARDGITRLDLGREKFLEKVWEWKEIKGGRICEQMRRMGCSMDWTREVFTLDDKLSTAVTEAFVRMFDKGLIYRANRLCHWSCSLESAISNAEVDLIQLKGPTLISVPNYEKKVKFGIIHKFSYKVCNSITGDVTGEELIVATTRLETMLGDSAVAVHPSDDRYKHLHGKFVLHPFLKRKIPIICDDELVDMEFGTGAVKITPAHDENDFNCGMKHGLDFINVFTTDGKINKNGGEFEGMPRFKCRIELIKKFKEMGQFYGEEKNEMTLQICSRSKDVIEPMMKPQWYVDCDDLAKRSVEAVDNGDLTIRPKEGVQQWHYFLDNIRPWCVSRQLWWGHRIPAWLARPVNDSDEQKDQPTKPNFADEHSHDMNNWIVARNIEEAKKIAAERFGVDKVASGAIRLDQDPDVLDTWFSSGLFPFSTLGWPNEEDPDLQQFFPGSLLETGGDILFFWVARMVMMSLCLTDKLPFTDVFLHSMVRDKDGSKMSKTKGNVIDPLHIIDGVSLQTLIDELHVGNLDPKEVVKSEKRKKQDFPKGIPPCGSDALRFGLLSYMAQTGDIKLDVSRVIGYRHFCNKIWNAVRFAMANFPKGYVPPSSLSGDNLKCSELLMADQYILSRLNECITLCDKANAEYDFGTSSNGVYHFFVHEFCDVYLEAIKPVFHSKAADQPVTEEYLASIKPSCDTLFACLEISFRLMHPFMPFVTEELWQRLPGRVSGKESIMIAEYPSSNDLWNNTLAEQRMDEVTSLVAKIRSAKQDLFGLPTRSRYPVQITALGSSLSSSSSDESDSKVQSKDILQSISDNRIIVQTLSLSTEVSIESGSADRKSLMEQGWFPVDNESDGYTVWHKVNQSDSIKVNWAKQKGKLSQKQKVLSEELAEKKIELAEQDKPSLKRKIESHIQSLESDISSLSSLCTLFSQFE